MNTQNKEKYLGIILDPKMVHISDTDGYFELFFYK